MQVYKAFHPVRWLQLLWFIEQNEEDQLDISLCSNFIEFVWSKFSISQQWQAEDYFARISGGKMEDVVLIFLCRMANLVNVIHKEMDQRKDLAAPQRVFVVTHRNTANAINV